MHPYRDAGEGRRRFLPSDASLRDAESVSEKSDIPSRLDEPTPRNALVAPRTNRHICRFRKTFPDYHVSCDAGVNFYGDNRYATTLGTVPKKLMLALWVQSVVRIPDPRCSTIRAYGKGETSFALTHFRPYTPTHLRTYTLTHRLALSAK